MVGDPGGKGVWSTKGKKGGLELKKKMGGGGNNTFSFGSGCCRREGKKGGSLDKKPGVKTVNRRAQSNGRAPT